MGRARGVASPDYGEVAEQYARDVLEGRVLACKWVKLACARHLNDLERDDFEFYWDGSKARLVCQAVEKMPHIKGKWTGGRIKLEPWQTFILCVVFGWVHRDTGYRRFRSVYIEVPRKNAKSTLTSAVALFMLTIDGEPGAEVYSAATTRDQAKIVFTDAQNMARRSPQFRERYHVQVGAHSIVVEPSASKFEALSAEGNTLDGLNPHFASVDELHAHKTRSVHDVLETAMGSRTQALFWKITTAGSDRSGICYEQRTYVTKILDSVFADESYFGIIYTIDEGDDWTDPKVWEKANPNYGVSVFPDDLARLARKAMETPAAQSSFLTKRLDVWVNADSAWMDMRAWDECADPSLSTDDFAGEPCLVALDLASRDDMAAMMALFVKPSEKGRHYYAFGKYYLPETTIEAARNSQYQGWASSGKITTTEGNTIDFGQIKSDLRELASKFQVREVPFDPFQANQFATEMVGEGFTMVEMRHTVLNMSEPMKELGAAVRDRRFHHDGDPVLSWMASNVVAHLDVKDNIYPRKERPENKIDGIVALIMAVGREITQPAPVEPTIHFLQFA